MKQMPPHITFRKLVRQQIWWELV